MKNSNMRKGIFFLVVALALLGNAFGIFEITTSAFKLVLSAVLLTYSLSSIFKRHFTDGLVMLSFVYLLNEKVVRELFNFNQVNGWMLFRGALFLGIGLDSIFKRNRKFFIYESKTKSKNQVK